MSLYESFTQEFRMGVNYLGLTGNAARLLITDGLYTQLVADLAKWEAQYLVYNDVANRSRSVVANTKTMYDDLFSKYNHLKRSLKNNLEIELLDDDYVNLSLHRNKPRGTVPAPTEVPVITQLKDEHLLSYFQISYRQLPDFNHRNWPDGVNAANIEYFMQEDASKVPPTSSQFSLLKTTSQCTFSLEFNSDDEGKRVFLKVAYLNPKKEAGPFSEVISFVIS